MPARGPYRASSRRGAVADPGLRSGELLRSRAFAPLFRLLLASLSTLWALDQPAGPGGAPDPKPGPFRSTGFVRVVDCGTWPTFIGAGPTTGW